MFQPLKTILKKFIVRGDVTVIDRIGCRHTFGDGGEPHIQARIADKATERALALDPQLAFGEAYMDGRLAVESGSIYDLIVILQDGIMAVPVPAHLRVLDSVRMALRRVQQFNPMGRSERNVRHHYDIEPELYRLFLDAAQQYSCAYFRPGDDLELAQIHKIRRLAAKLAIEPGHRVLDIGSGWGGLGAYIAQTCDADVHGVTLSSAQLEQSRKRAQSLGLERNLRFELQDYRRLESSYDRIVSVGMLEHVGVDHYATYFHKIANLLDNNGVALIHTIGRSDGPGFTNPFIAKYIFPGGYFPALSELLPAIERSGLILTDVEVLRLHYAETLRAWRERFMAHVDWVRERKGGAFCRMWEFYLAASEGAFRYQGLVVFQLQLTKRIDALPTTRDYIGDREARLALREKGADTEHIRLVGE